VLVASRARAEEPHVKRVRITLLFLVACGAVVAAAPTSPPAFTHSRAEDWLNSPPLTLAGLKGKVVVVEFWAFECDNCIKSRAWIDSLEHEDGPAGLVVVGVHSPELDAERSASAVRTAVQRLGIHHPVMIDTDHSYWNALHVQYWPTFCLIGRDGLLYACIPGEMDQGDERASKVAAAVEQLLKVPAA
jgi:thiol-disulfide isomerase/thioredoxin